MARPLFSHTLNLRKDTGLWTASATAITPSTATAQVKIPGPTSGDQSQLVFGTRTIKGRLWAVTGSNTIGMRVNCDTGTVMDDTSGTAWSLNMAAGGVAGDAFALYHAPAGASAVFTQMLQVDNVGNLTINGATATKASGTTWVNPSDRRLKDSIEDYTTGLAAVQQLMPRTFVYNGNAGSEAGLKSAGFVSDEVAPVMPEMIQPYSAKLKPEDAEETELYAVDQSHLILALVNAVKELAARVEALEARPPHGP